MARPTGRQADARQMRREKVKGHVCFVGARMGRSKGKREGSAAPRFSYGPSTAMRTLSPVSAL